MIQTTKWLVVLNLFEEILARLSSRFDHWETIEKINISHLWNEKNIKTITEAIRDRGIHLSQLLGREASKNGLARFSMARGYTTRKTERYFLSWYVYLCSMCVQNQQTYRGRPKYGIQYRTCFGEFKINYGTNPLAPYKMFPITIERLLYSKRYRILRLLSFVMIIEGIKD